MNGRIEGNASEPLEMTPAGEVVEGFSESLFEILWRRRWTVLLATIVALAAGFVYLQRVTPQYTSTSRIYVEQEGLPPLETTGAGTVRAWSNYLYTQAELIKRTETLSTALASPAMGHLQTFAEISNPIAALRKGLQIVVGKKDEIINVSFTSPSAEEAASIVNTVVDAYITAHNERKRDTSAEVVKLLKEERVASYQELDEKRKAMALFQREHENLAYGTSPENNTILTKLLHLDAELTAAQLAALDSRSHYEAVRQMAGDSSALRRYVEAQRRGVYIASANEIVVLRAELLRVRRTRADSLQELKPHAPQIVALDAEIERLESQIAELDKTFADSVVAAAQERMLEAAARQKDLEAMVAEQSQTAEMLNRQLVDFALLQSDYERAKKFCDILDDRIRVISVDPQVTSLNVEIIEVAKPATVPSEPQKARTMGLALCLGLFAGVGLGLLREWKDQRLRSTQEISALLGLPILGAIPTMRAPKQTVAIRGQKIRISPESHEAEAYRTVRTALFFGAPKDEARTILFTSPAPGEGKSTAVSNLGIAMAQADQRTLIVDADFRRPMQHRIFSLDRRARGLSLVLAGQMELTEAIDHMGMKNLDVLTCGPDVSNPSEMLNSSAFAEIVKTLAQKYDRVLIDSPPVIAVADAQILAALCDVTVLMLRAQQSTRRVTLQACESLVGVDGRLLGVVVNDVPRKSDRYGYSSGYGYYNYNYRRDGNGHSKKEKKIPIEAVERRQNKRRDKHLEKLRAGLMPGTSMERFPHS